jgi:hypothetical protein
MRGARYSDTATMTTSEYTTSVLNHGFMGRHREELD